MYACGSEPALRTVRTAFLMCWPVAQAAISCGPALLASMTKWKSCTLTLPAPPPPLKVPELVAPQLKDWISMALLTAPAPLSKVRPTAGAALGASPVMASVLPFFVLLSYWPVTGGPRLPSGLVGRYDHSILAKFSDSDSCGRSSPPLLW